MRFSIDFIKALYVLIRALFPIWGGIALVISLSGVWLADLEELPVTEGLYFAWVTGTTVGYGDIVPTNGLSQFLAVCIALLGIVMSGIIVAVALEAAKLSIEQNGSLDALKTATKQQLEEKANERDQE